MRHTPNVLGACNPSCAGMWQLHSSRMQMNRANGAVPECLPSYRTPFDATNKKAGEVSALLQLGPTHERVGRALMVRGATLTVIKFRGSYLPQLEYQPVELDAVSTASCTAPVHCVALLKDGRLVLGLRNKTLSFFDLSSKRVFGTTKLPHLPVALLVRAKMVLVAMTGGDIAIVNVASKEITSTLSGHKCAVFSMQVLQEPLVCTASKDGVVCVWRLPSSQTEPEQLLSFSPFPHGAVPDVMQALLPQYDS
jgi:hypothetical protein